jgi:hypothetical protein
MLEKILRNEKSQKLFAFLIGFGIVVMLFHRPIPIQLTLGMDPAELLDKEAKVNGKCYKYRVEDSKCDLSSHK